MGGLDRSAEPFPNAEREQRLLELRRYFTIEEKRYASDLHLIERDAVIRTGDRVFFEQRGVTFPDDWSQNAINIVSSRYFSKTAGQEETSLLQLVDRVASVITGWGVERGYFDAATAGVFRDELSYVLSHQQAAFNSPVWFNVGVSETPQCAACFILSVDDSLESILEWYATEALIFSDGSGSGVNLSALRSDGERLSFGGRASGPVSFMRPADSIAGTIRAGGKARRAAKMVILDADHPDVLGFIWCKAREERKATALRESGFDLSVGADAWLNVGYQNANNSVRATDEFMKAAVQGRKWELRNRRGSKKTTVEAKDVLRQVAEAAWQCADPGMQFEDTINDWHTCPNSGRINASNPCGEYLFIDDTACNLASINLLRFLDPTTLAFDEAGFRHTVDVLITAMEIIVEGSSYPTEKIAQRAKAHRTLGLGYSNLGATLMSLGLPYDSDGAREWAAQVTSLMSAEAYCQSARLARVVGPFEAYEANQKAVRRVVKKHAKAAESYAGSEVWNEALALGDEHGYRNAQVTVIAPTGTISFMMDCDTTGIEPDLSLVKYKALVDGGTLTIVNQSVERTLERLGYSPTQVQGLTAYLLGRGMLEGAPGFKEEHLPVFDCALRPESGTRSISWQGHLKMVAAVQPFLSGGVSKTINLPNDATVEDVEQVYVEAWKQGVKAVSIYRDGSKNAQPLTTESRPHSHRRKHLPETRQSVTHKFSIAGQDGYITAGLYSNGQPGEVFVTISKQGSTLSGLMDSFATSVSLALQYGVPLDALVKKFVNYRFDPSGVTHNKDIPIASSVVDYLFRWLDGQFLKGDQREQTADASSAPCLDCGNLMVRHGPCLYCEACGATTGCS